MKNSFFNLFSQQRYHTFMHNGKVPKVFSMFLIVPDNILQKNNIILQKKTLKTTCF